MDEAVIKRTLPFSSSAEQSVIGSMLISRDAVQVAKDLITSEDFYQPQHGVIFDAIISLYDSNQAIDAVTLMNKLQESNVSPEFCSIEFISNILTSVPSSGNIQAYAEIVRDKSILRKTIKAAEDIATRCYQDSEPIDEIMDDAEKKIFKISQESRRAGDFVSISDATMRTFNSIHNASKSKGNVTGIRTGFTDLDYRTAGLQKSDLILIAARPAMGKTAFALSMAEYVAVKSKIPTAIFSLEMSDEQLLKRIMAMDASIDLHAITTGDLTGEEWESLVESVQNIGNSELILVDNLSGLTINDICSKCRKLKIERDLGLVIIDYLQLIEGNGRSESRQQEIAGISRTLKSLARELNIPIIALSQLNRGVESREDKRPKLSDLRESGAIEQDADIVMFLYRDEVYFPNDPDNKGKAELIIGKHRNGEIGTVNLAWIGQYTRYANAQYSGAQHNKDTNTQE
ncbi:MAG: replicative DNA helicase [Lachnospiraceae bacterium]|nr:replicative DNA helicase [Lachnospiraceae bacterium]